MTEAGPFRWSRKRVGAVLAMLAPGVPLCLFALGLEPSDIETMSRGRFEALQFVVRVGFPFIVYVVSLTLVRFVFPTLWAPRFQGGRLRVQRSPLAPWSQWFDLAAVVEVRKLSMAVVLVMDSGSKLKVALNLLADEAGFMATLRERIDAAAPAGRVPPE
jgi:hypothetical protein